MRAAGLPEQAQNGERRPAPPPITDPVLNLPTVPAECFTLPKVVGQLFDETILPPDALRRLANWWIRLSHRCIMKLGDVVRPLRNAAEATRLQTRVSNTRDVRNDNVDNTSDQSGTGSDEETDVED